MELVDKFDGSYDTEERTIYTVEIGTNRFVDVMNIKNKNSWYVMVEGDGKPVCDTDRNTFDLVIDEGEIIAFILSKIPNKNEVKI